LITVEAKSKPPIQQRRLAVTKRAAEGLSEISMDVTCFAGVITESLQIDYVSVLTLAAYHAAKKAA
jgi:hypothetical protein